MNNDDTVTTNLRPDGVFEITLNRPTLGNRFDVAMLGMLCTAMEKASDPAVRAILLTHTGDAFCLGGMLGDARQQDAGTVQRFSGMLKKVLIAIFMCPVPVIAAIEGDVEGGGLSIVEACDMAAAASHALFAIPEILTEMPPVISFCGAYRVLPAKRLMQLALLGDKMSAEEAEHIGLITKVVKPGQAVSTCNAWSAQFIGRNPAALETIRTLRQRMDGGDYTMQLQSAADALVSVMMHKATWDMLDDKDLIGGKRDDQTK